MRSYTGWCGSADYLINHISQSSQSFGWHDNARSYNSAHGWWLLPCHQIADVIPGMSEREYCNRAGNFDVEWAGRKRLWDIVRVNYRRMGLGFRLVWHDRISCFRVGVRHAHKIPHRAYMRTSSAANRARGGVGRRAHMCQLPMEGYFFSRSPARPCWARASAAGSARDYRAFSVVVSLIVAALDRAGSEAINPFQRTNAASINALPSRSIDR